MTLNLHIAIVYVLCMYVALGSGYFFPVAVSRTLCRQVITLTGSLNSTMSPAEHNCRGGGLLIEIHYLMNPETDLFLRDVQVSTGSYECSNVHCPFWTRECLVGDSHIW